MNNKIQRIFKNTVYVLILLFAAGCGSVQPQHVQANKPVAAYQINYNADTNALSIKSIDVTPPHAGQNIAGLAGVFQSGPTILSGNLITAPVYIVNNSTSPWTGVEMQMYQLLTGSSVLAEFPDFGTGWYINNPSYGAWGWLFTSGTPGSPFTIPAGGKSVNKVIGYNANSSFAAWAYIYANVPIVTGISPLGALAGQPITISGYNFGTSPDSVTFNGVTATVMTWSSTSITATVPANVTLGDIFVNTVDANTPYSNGAIFTPYSIFAPSVTNPFGITVDTIGNLYVASNSTNYIKRITPAGVVSNYSKSAGRGTLNSPTDVAMDPTGTGMLYVPSYNNNDVVTVDTSGNATAFTTTGFNGPDALYFSQAGQSWPLFVANGGNGTISEVASNKTTTEFASGFTQPTALTVDASGNVYVGECTNGSVYKINAAGTVTTTVVTGLVCPTCMKQDASGNIYILDNTATSTMYKYNPATGNLSFYVAGNGIMDANGGFAFSPDFSLLYVGQTQPINDVTVIPLK
jgi:sugar lactone lactonase YvrE